MEIKFWEGDLASLRRQYDCTRQKCIEVTEDKISTLEFSIGYNFDRIGHYNRLVICKIYTRVPGLINVETLRLLVVWLDDAGKHGFK